MKIVASIYRTDTGNFTGRTYCGPARHLRLDDGEAWIEGLHDHLSRKVDPATGEVVVYQPPAPTDTEFETFAWGATIERWIPTPTAAAHWRAVRAERDRRLRETDWVVIRGSERGERVSAEWLAYRQALRDITTQPDPLSIEWPEPPA